LSGIVPDGMHGMNADMLEIVIFLTPAGTRDEGGVLQPAYLNFDAMVLGPPASDMTVSHWILFRVLG
jgi:hypothetical protein